MKKHQIVISALLLIGLFSTVYQYIVTFKEEIVAAVQTIPNPGHLWAEMESGPDSIQVTGRTITNLTAPVASTDATNKEYVDAAGGGGCYNVWGANTCASGYTAVYTGTSGTFTGGVTGYNSAVNEWYSSSGGGVLCIIGGASNTAAITNLGGGVTGPYTFGGSNNVGGVSCALCCK